MLTPTKRSAAAAAAIIACTGLARAQAHEALIIVNPNDPESLHTSNYYANARGVPSTGLTYFDPDPNGYSDFIATRVPAVLGTIANHRNENSIDYLILPAGTHFRMNAPGYVSDGCSPVSLFSTTGAYTTTRFVSLVEGGVTSLLSNGYFSSDGEPREFDNGTTYTGGNPGPGQLNGRPYIACALGYTGPNGNTLEEILSLIDTSVSADGTFPTGTFRFLQTNDAARSGPRHSLYTAAANRINAAGGSALRTTGQNLPSGGEVVTGAMSGFANDDIVGADFTFAPGAFADHLTSFAATFTDTSQTKLSEWITKGAVGSFGAVQEPCNYPNKFPSAYMHSMYFSGLTLGEACLRSLQAVPFQGMMYGDPLCRPFAHIPVVNPGGVPTGPVTGNFTLNPSATTTHPTAGIAKFDVYVDGILRASDPNGTALVIRTGNLDDGWHELRVVAYDDTLVATQGEWVGSFITINHGKILGVTPPASNIDRSGTIDMFIDTNDQNVLESRLLHNERVVAAIPGRGQIGTRGEIVGAGPARLRVEVDFADGSTARSEPFIVNVDNTNPPSGTGGPTAYDFTKTVKPGHAFILELPALHETELDEPSFAILSGPTQGTVLSGSGRFRIVEANAGATGTDQITYRVTSNGTSDTGTITINYYDPDAEPCLADTNFDGIVSAADFSAWVQAYNLNLAFIADQNRDGIVSPADFSAWVGNFNRGCDF